MEKMVLRVGCVICVVFAFLAMWDMLNRTTNIEISLPFVLLGVGLYASTFLSYRRLWHRAVIWFIAILWSAYVFLLIGTSIHLPTINNVPHWMQAANPYVYASAPFIIIWAIRSVVPMFWKREV